MRRASLVLAAIAFSLHTSLAEDSPAAAEKKFLQVPGEIASFRTVKKQAFAKPSLPPALSAALAKWDWGQSVPDTFHGYKIDLNGDGKNEYLIVSAMASFGDDHILIMHQGGAGWDTLANFQGSFHLLPRKNGWHPIVAVNTIGPGNHSKVLYEYRDGSYHIIEAEFFSDGAITKKTVRE